jgi:hypothetical protein
MRKTVVATAFLIGLMTFALAASLVHAAPATSASIWTTDSIGNPKNQFNPGETVYIHWSVAPPGSTVDIYIQNSGGVTIATVGLTLDANTQQPQTWVTTTTGFYKVVAVGAVNSVVYEIAVGTFFIVPESVFGTILAVISGFAAFGTLRLAKRNRLRFMK